MAISEKELDSLIEVKGDIEKVSTISSDGRSFLTRIPKEIAEELKLKKGSKLSWFVKLKEKKIILVIE